jgi:integrase
MPLTDTACRNAKPGERARKLADERGLYLLVNRAGKYWRWDYRHAGKRKTMALGTYPEVPLAKAREALDEARKLLAEGVDPMAARKTAKLTRRIAQANSFEAVARAWWAKWGPSKTARHADYVLRRLKADLFPVIGHVPVNDLTAPTLLAAVRRIEERGAIDIAKRALQTAGQILRYAVAHGLAERNPAADVQPSDALTPRKKANYARIGEKELPGLLTAIEDYVGGEHTRLALKLMTLTFVRTSELIGARWSEFEGRDGKAPLWRIPAERMKMKTEHLVPLSRQALAVLDELEKWRFGRELVFPGERDHARPMSNNTLLYALYRMGYRGRMTGHGFRGVASTILHEQGWPHEHIELQLAHQERDDVAASYNHALYLPQRAEMMQAWADYVDRARTGAEIVPAKAA